MSQHKQFLPGIQKSQSGAKHMTGIFDSGLIYHGKIPGRTLPFFIIKFSSQTGTKFSIEKKTQFFFVLFHGDGEDNVFGGV